MNFFTVIFLLVLVVSVLVQLWLVRRQIAHVDAHSTQVPQLFRDRVTVDAHRKAADYTVAKTRFSGVELLYDTAVLLALTLGGGLSLLDHLWRQLGYGPIATGVGVIISVMVGMGLITLPLSAFEKFRIEAHFGFNRASPQLFISDTLKEGVLLVLIGAPLTAVVLWLMEHSGGLWWFYVWLVWMLFTFFMMWAYPAFIAPLFNKFAPLKDQGLIERIHALLARCGFESQGVFVMDGSRRSGHGNAYFTGIGNKKRIVFYDTLLNTLDDEEIEAVLAHELGHFKRKHVVKRLALMMFMSFAGLVLLGWLINQPWFFAGLGIPQPSTYAALLLFLLVAPVFGTYLQPITAYTMRKHEFEADDFAAQQTGPDNLISALVKLYEENASTLTPDPIYSAFHDSHPPAPVRVANLNAKAN